MQTTIIQQIPLAFLTVAMNSTFADQPAFATGSAASMEWSACTTMPRHTSELPFLETTPAVAPEPAVPLMALARALLPESRAMADWERKDADEFFWSQFT